MKRMIHKFLAISFVAVLLSGCGNGSSDTIKEAVSDISTETEAAEAVESSKSIEEPFEPESTEEAQQAEPVETAESESTEVIEDVFVEESPTEDAIAEEQEVPAYTYTDLSKVMYAQQSVNVRDLPSTDGNKLGALSLNQEVTITGQCNETSWYRIEYNGAAAYVSSRYLGDSVVAAVQPETQTQSSQTGKYTVFYMENSGGTWYATSDGLTCDYYNNSMGRLVNEPAYTLEGLKATFPNIGEVIYNEDGSIKMLVCGCCASVYENYGIATFVEACNLADSMGYVFDHLGEDFTWVASTPDTWPHNLTWYYFVKE